MSVILRGGTLPFMGLEVGLRAFVLVVFAVGCAPVETVEPVDTEDSPVDTDIVTTPPIIVDTGETGDTGTPPLTTYDCTTPWPASMGAHTVSAIASSEDFDIMADGYLVHIEGGNLVARSYLADDSYLVAANVASNAAGTRVLKNGDIAVSNVSSGTLMLVNYQTGAKTTLLSRNWPNGIDVDKDDYIYITDFADSGSLTKVNAYDPNDMEILAQDMYRPNGVVLSPDGMFLYIAANWIDQIWRMERDVNGDWGNLQVWQDQPGVPQSVTTDACGTVYWENWAQVRRKSADGGQSGGVADAGGGYFPNLRWGNDVGGFKRDHLYGLSSGQMWEFHVGIPGKKHISIQ